MSNKIQEFRKSESYRSALIQTLNSPAMQAALNAVESTALPTVLPDLVPGQAFDITVSHAFYEKMGIIKAINTLRSLVLPPNDIFAGDEENEFEHALPPELR